ncbi:Uncharacterised protein [Mycobacterium tuberculosis]|nr:Uncharacterised protein [Mycobacterium tuberculosis]
MTDAEAIGELALHEALARRELTGVNRRPELVCDLLGDVLIRHAAHPGPFSVSRGPLLVEQGSFARSMLWHQTGTRQEARVARCYSKTRVR